ncbi:HNH endonuclease [Microbacterium sp. DT81.1]|uniref:HNH endonuclease signature motif containing protein n=1 Tax=Microbacterium sp. DT81.1 TaxID=3393413 RepID=UPI003CEE65E9
MGEGRISRAHVSVIVQAGFGIDDADASAGFEDEVLRRAYVETPGRLGPIAKLLANRAQPRTLEARHADARAERTVRMSDLPDGMGELILLQPSVLIHGIFDRITQQAQTVKEARTSTAGADTPLEASDRPVGSDGSVRADEGHAADVRTMDQLRADILADMLLTGTPSVDDPDAGIDLGAIRATVQVTVPVLALTGHGSEPAVLAGSGPIDPETARSLAGGCPGWERVMTHPVTGAVLAVDRYRPGEDLKRLLRVRDEHCRFPGCRMPAHRCDLDHTHDAAHGGATSDANLAHLCKRHHTLKHATPWTVKQRSGGVLEWTSPTGRTYTDTPEPVLRFTASSDPPPF